MGFFDFITEIPPYCENSDANLRLNKRYKMIVEPFRGQLEGARVLDLGAHDGRWSYALAEAGARQVVGIEARSDLIARFSRFPDTPFKKRVDLRLGDVFEALESFVSDGEEFDVVAVFGIYYHIMDHFRLLQLIRLVGAKLVIIDSEFMLAKGPMIQLVFEKTSTDLNAAPQIAGQERAVVGIPSFRAMNAMAQALGYDLIWGRAGEMFGGDRKGIQDYFRTERMRRAACVLHSDS